MTIFKSPPYRPTETKTDVLKVVVHSKGSQKMEKKHKKLTSNLDRNLSWFLTLCLLLFFMLIFCVLFCDFFFRFFFLFYFQLAKVKASKLQKIKYKKKNFNFIIF